MIIGKTRTNQPVESDKALDDKLVNLPLPATTSQGGKVLAVNSAGTGYELKTIEGVTGLYCHPIYVIFNDLPQRVVMLIFNNDSTEYNTVAKLITALDLFVSTNTRILLSGAFKDSGGNLAIASYMYKSGGNYYIVGFRVDNGAETFVQFDAEDMSITDGVNQIL